MVYIRKFQTSQATQYLKEGRGRNGKKEERKKLTKEGKRRKRRDKRS